MLRTSSSVRPSAFSEAGFAISKYPFDSARQAGKNSISRSNRAPAPLKVPALEIHIQFTQAGSESRSASSVRCRSAMSTPSTKIEVTLPAPSLIGWSTKSRSPFPQATRRPLKDNFHVFSDKRFSRYEGVIEQNKKLCCSTSGTASRTVQPVTSRCPISC